MKRVIDTIQQSNGFSEPRTIIKRFGVRQRILDLILCCRFGGRLNRCEQNKSKSEHQIPLRKVHLDRSVFFSDPVTFRWEVRVLENQNASNWNANSAERCLPQCMAR